MPFAIVASDNFSGVAGTTLPARGMDAGGGGAANAWIAYSANAQIDGAGGADQTGPSALLYDGTSAAQGDQYAECVVAVTVAASMRGPVVRFDPATGNGYWVDTGFGGGTPRLWKMNGGGFGGLALLAAGGTVAAGDVLRLEYVGGTLSVYVNGALQFAFVDGAPHGPGVGGLGWYWAGVIEEFAWYSDAAPPGGSYDLLAEVGAT